MTLLRNLRLVDDLKPGVAKPAQEIEGKELLADGSCLHCLCVVVVAEEPGFALRSSAPLPICDYSQRRAFDAQ